MFLLDPRKYLVIWKRAKGWSGSLLHQVLPVARDIRLAAIFWVQSMVREPVMRQMLYDLNLTIQSLGQRVGLGDPDVMHFCGLYHNLLRHHAGV